MHIIKKKKKLLWQIDMKKKKMQRKKFWEKEINPKKMTGTVLILKKRKMREMRKKSGMEKSKGKGRERKGRVEEKRREWSRGRERNGRVEGKERERARGRGRGREMEKVTSCRNGKDSSFQNG